MSDSKPHRAHEMNTNGVVFDDITHTYNVTCICGWMSVGNVFHHNANATFERHAAERHHTLVFLIHELDAGRPLPNDWRSRAVMEHAIRTHAEHEGITPEKISSAVFTEEQLDRMRASFHGFHTGLEPGEIFPHGLTFKALRAANLARCPLFKNAKGETQHSGKDWSLADWMVAVAGEVGEAANVLKKVRRGDMPLEEARPKLAQEFADVLIYLDLLASECGVNLGDAVIETFNGKSDQLQLDLFLTETGPVRERPG